MGERLVVKVERDDILLATIYYHWSAYTETSAKIIKNLYNHVLVNANQMSDDEIRLALIRFAEHSTSMGYVEDMTTLDRIQKERLAALDPSAPNYGFLTDWISKETQCHGGVSSADRELVKSLFPNEIFLTENVSRNEGLVSVSVESMQSAINWADSLATIDLTEDTYALSVPVGYSVLGWKNTATGEYVTSVGNSLKIEINAAITVTTNVIISIID